MGQTLENGVYLPSEGERNCYAGLKTNWEILDQKVADVTALQQAVAGALHREIVESLPTTDIDPNTIYMVLSGTSATENVYNEFMYVNNAWELIGTSATDLTNYYTKAEVDGKLLLKANASDLTSHTGDTTIHVTASDKTKWNNGVTQSYVFRYSSTALVASSTNSNTLLDNTDNLKVGDKVIDSDGVLFSITAIDTANSTFTVGSALIDLALDANVVHTSGVETVGGNKTFTNDVTVNNSNATVQADVPNLVFKNSLMERASTTLDGEQTILFTDKNDNNIGSIQAKTYTSGISDIILTSYSETSDQSVRTTGIVIRRSPTTSKFHGYSDNVTSLGDTNRRWSKVYAMTYYYGNDNVEFSTKFVTSDTNQTISGSKTFARSILIYNSDNTANTPNLILQSSKIQVGDTSNSDSFGIVFNAGSSYASRIIAYKDTSGTQNLQLSVRTKDSSNNFTGAMIRLRSYTNGFNSFESDGDNLVSLGSSSNKWKNVQTNLVNGLTPSSLSMPSGTLADQIDISSYFANTGTGEENSYTASANGWIYLYVTACKTLTAYVQNGTDTIYSDYRERSSDGQIRIMLPIQKNNKFTAQWTTSTTVSITRAVFIPCQGNI